MISVGIDVGKRPHEVCLLDADGHQIGSFFRLQHSRQGMASLAELFPHQPEPRIIALEATSHYWLALYQHLLQEAFTVVTINALQSHAYRRSTIRKVKGDREDAWNIADLLRVGRVRPGYVPGPDIQPLRDLARFRMELVDQVGDAKRRILGVLDKVFPEYESLFPSVFIATSRELLNRAATAEEFAALDLKEIVQVVNKGSHSRLGMERAERLQQAARTSLGLPYPRDAATVEFLEVQAEAIEAAIERLFS